MPVSVNPIRNDSEDRNIQLLSTAINLAKDVYKVSMDEKQTARLQDIAKVNREADLDKDQQKQVIDFTKDFEVVDPTKPGAIDPGATGLRLPKGINLPQGMAIRPRSISEKEASLAGAKAEKEADRLNQRIIAGINAATKKDTQENKPTTEGERLTAVYGQRLEQANNILQDLESDPNAGLTNWDTAFALNLPNSMQGKSTQKFEQAKRNFLNAALRKESGASISPEERESGNLQYFPQFGDTPEVLEQKRQNRQLVIDGFKVAAGKAWGNLDTAVANNKDRLGQGGDNSVVAVPKELQQKIGAAQIPQSAIEAELLKRQKGTASR
jgi:hypothetical protein